MPELSANVSDFEVLGELLAREASSRTNHVRLYENTFPAQQAFISDPARLKAALCTRRAGKSYGAGSYMFQVCMENPGMKCLYLAKTRPSAKSIMWDDVLHVLDKRLGTNAEFHLGELKVVFPNGASIQLLGADASESERDKLLGQKYKLVIIDEAEAYQHVDLRKLIYITLKPTTWDYGGTICLIGMPNDINYGLFYDVTTHNGLDETEEYGVKPWSMHRWSTLDNPFMREKFLAEIAAEKLVNPNVEKTAAFKQSCLGEWSVSDNSYVYHFNTLLNTFDGTLPKHKNGEWHYIMGLDTGWTDATAMSVAAYHDYDRTLYMLATFKKSEMPFDDMVRKIKTFFQEFPIERIIVDPANKHIVESLKARLQLPIQSAEKSEKMAHIKIMNADLTSGRIKFGPNCQSVIEEYGKLVKNEDGEEDPRCKNDSADSCLYNWRYCYHFLSEKQKEKVVYGTPEYMEEEVRKSMERAAASRQKEQQDPFAFQYDGPSPDDFYNRQQPDFYGSMK